MKLFKLLDFSFRYVVQNVFNIRIRPRELQLPVTGRCNSRCLTCNVWKHPEGKDIDVAGLKVALSDPFFSRITVVGINGGEPSLFRRPEELLDALMVLKRLRHLYIISNGLLTSRLLEMMEKVKAYCTLKEISVHLCISIDGIGPVHDQVRGIPGAYKKSMHTLECLKADPQRYCNTFEAGFTVSRANVFYLSEAEVFLQQADIPVHFHLAVPNRRLNNFENQNFSVLDDELARLAAMEFFFFRFKYGRDIKQKLRSFLTYHYLLHWGKLRLAGCNYLKSDVTVTENLDLYLCATASRKVGSLTEKTATQLLQEGKLEEVYRETRQYCQHCVHYIVFPMFRGVWYFVGELLRPAVWIKYRWMAWLR